MVSTYSVPTNGDNLLLLVVSASWVSELSLSVISARSYRVNLIVPMVSVSVGVKSLLFAVVLQGI